MSFSLDLSMAIRSTVKKLKTGGSKNAADFLKRAGVLTPSGAISPGLAEPKARVKRSKKARKK